MKAFRLGKKPEAFDTTDSFVQKWRPIDGWLVEEKNGQFVLPTHHSKIGLAIYRKHCQTVKRQFRWSLSAILLACLYFAFEPSPHSHQRIVVYLCMLLMIGGDTCLTSKSLQYCKQHAEHVYQISHSFLHIAKIFIPLFSAIFLVQIWGIHRFGSTDTLIIKYGNYYPEITIASGWRILIGTFLHLDYVHWLVNLVMTVILASATPALSPVKRMMLFLVGAIGAHIITFGVHSYFPGGHDALAGVSGGTFALLGFTVSYYALRKRYLSVTYSLMSLAVFSVVASELLTTNVSHLAHVSGFLLGCSYFLIWQRRSETGL